MNSQVEISTNAIMKSNSVEEALALITSTYEIDFITFHLLKNEVLAFSNPFVRTTYPDAWVRQYLLNNYISRDPVIEHVVDEGESFCWSELRIKPVHKPVLRASVEFGLGTCGYTFVYTDGRGRQSALSVNSSKTVRKWRDYIEPLIDEFETFLPVVHKKGVTEALAEREGAPCLTSREHECLSMSANGRSYSDIAMALDLSEHTVRSYLKMARTKLGSATLTQAVGKAVRSGIL